MQLDARICIAQLARAGGQEARALGVPEERLWLQALLRLCGQTQPHI